MAIARRTGFRGWDHTMEAGLGDYSKGWPGHSGNWTPAEITALGQNWHYDDLTGLLTNAFPVDPVSMGMAWDNDTGAYQTSDFFNARAAASLKELASPAVPAYPMCGPNLPTGTMCDPGYGDHAIPNPPHPAGSVGPVGPLQTIFGHLPVETQGIKEPLITAPVIPEQTPFDPAGVTTPSDVFPPGAGTILGQANDGGMPAPIAPPTATPAGVSGFTGTAMLALLGIVGAVLVMSKEQRR